ncbi:GH11024 [Drosophila grimshawi]|uniref:GH11024 n=3 Tax=Drosophila grimshawi TaxID=7222 RepID=B4JC34_DROGR|nr:GH11024 [Drosophila grimshawi]
MATTTTTSSTSTTTTATTTSKRYLSNFLTAAEAESTLSNVTSIHTQLQSSLYETQSTAQLKALDKHSMLLQELHQRQLLQAAPRHSSAATEATDAVVSSGTAAAGTKTATILVSKSKTKTGLPLLLKNSINN